MVGYLIIMLLGAGQPFDWECPQSVETGEYFALRIICSEPGCSGISTGQIITSSGLFPRGSSTSTSVATVTTPSGRELTQVVTLEMVFAVSGGGPQTIGPLQVNIRGIGSYTLEQINIEVNGSASEAAATTALAEDVWLAGTLHDPQGRIFPGTRLYIDYYVYARVGVGNVSYWWEAPELGVIKHVEPVPDSNWESANMKHDKAIRSLLAHVEMAPAAAGSLFAPVFHGEITGTNYDFWGKVSKWTIESKPILLPVYPFPENPPAGWKGTLLDSIALRVEQLPTPPGQGGELSVRVSCRGPGNIYINEPPFLSIHGNGKLTATDHGAMGNKRWWDYVFEPDQVGLCVLGPDSVVWLNRRTSTYQTAYTKPCSLNIAYIPRIARAIELNTDTRGGSPVLWVALGLLGVLALTVFSVITTKRRDKQLASVTDAEDVDELLSGLENELSRMLTGKKKYLGYSELDDYLDQCNADSFLARRILRFWKDLEQSLSDREIAGPAFGELKTTANELLCKLREDINSNDEKE